MSIPPHLDPEALAELLHSTAIRLLRAVRKADESSGLTASRLSALSVIVFSGSITLGKLADAEQVRPPTMTRIVNALERQGLIVKTVDPGDARVILIAATIRGKRMLLRGRARRVQLLAAQIHALDPAQRQNLSAALATIQSMTHRMN